ncbi:hypothetical protein MMC31_005073 [Peltigera leucophlebia]|nr:hypothetical protein [Peltigera leucophlebia]
MHSASPTATSPKAISPEVTSPKPTSTEVTSPQPSSPKVTLPKVTSPKVTSTKPALPALKTPTRVLSLPSLKTPTGQATSLEKPTNQTQGLKTPRSAMLPSELPRSPAQGFLDIIKQEDDIKTPITPPLAYTEFLKALSPAISSPSTGRSFTFSDRSGKSTPTSAPSSAGSACSCSNDAHKTSAPIIPPSPFMRPPPSARSPTTLRRLRIPQSPGYSPATDSPKSSAIRSPFSPADWYLDSKARIYESPRTPRSGCHRPVSVRQVVTRTVTYTRTPLDPAPKGKRRKLE